MAAQGKSLARRMCTAPKLGLDAAARPAREG